MNDITPQLISEIATRLYNEIPGAAAIPKTDSDTPTPSPEPMASVGLAGLSPSLLHLPPAETTNTESLAAPLTGDINVSDRIRDFVQSVRTTHFRPGAGLMADESEENRIRRLFTGQNSLAAGSRPFDVAAIRRDFPALHQQVHGKPLRGSTMPPRRRNRRRSSTPSPPFTHATIQTSTAERNTLAARATDAFEQARQKVQAFWEHRLPRKSSLSVGHRRDQSRCANVRQKVPATRRRDRSFHARTPCQHRPLADDRQGKGGRPAGHSRHRPRRDHARRVSEAARSENQVGRLGARLEQLGTILPVAEMTQMAKRYNARVLIDGAQSVAHLPVNVQQLGCDFFVFSGHKIFGPTGIGVVYAKEELLEIMPPWQGGGNMIRNVTFEEQTYSEAPAKFEAGHTERRRRRFGLRRCAGLREPARVA